MMYIFDTIIITDLAAFYKIKLFNQIARKKNIFVIFIESIGKKRNKDFFSGDKNFKFIILEGNRLKKTKSIISIISKAKYNRLIIGGWNSILYWIAVLFSQRKKTSIIVESSIYDSTNTGLKATLKKILLSRISKALVPGISNSLLLKALKFKGDIIITHGVGLYNRNMITPLRLLDSDAKKFLYVGRLSPEKNLLTLIKTFNANPNWTLSIVGFGPQESELKANAKSNITFVGTVKNTELAAIYQEHDVFILPSYREPWGLVVEEAINNGVPVALSKNVGAAEDWVGQHGCGIIFDPNNEDSIQNALNQIAKKDINNSIRKKILSIDFGEIEKKQIEAFI